jgi:hypothetical protein
MAEIDEPLEFFPSGPGAPAGPSTRAIRSVDPVDEAIDPTAVAVLAEHSQWDVALSNLADISPDFVNAVLLFRRDVSPDRLAAVTAHLAALAAAFSKGSKDYKYIVASARGLIRKPPADPLAVSLLGKIRMYGASISEDTLASGTHGAMAFRCGFIAHARGAYADLAGTWSQFERQVIDWYPRWKYPPVGYFSPALNLRGNQIYWSFDTTQKRLHLLKREGDIVNGNVAAFLDALEGRLAGFSGTAEAIMSTTEVGIQKLVPLAYSVLAEARSYRQDQDSWSDAMFTIAQMPKGLSLWCQDVAVFSAAFQGKPLTFKGSAMKSYLKKGWAEHQQGVAYCLSIDDSLAPSSTVEWPNEDKVIAHMIMSPTSYSGQIQIARLPKTAKALLALLVNFEFICSRGAAHSLWAYWRPATAIKSRSDQMARLSSCYMAYVDSVRQNIMRTFFIMYPAINYLPRVKLTLKVPQGDVASWAGAKNEEVLTFLNDDMSLDGQSAKRGAEALETPIKK